MRNGRSSARFLGEMGDPRTHAYLLVPFTEIEIDDDWHTLGLAGTGVEVAVAA